VTTEGGGSARTPLEALLLALRHSRGSHLTGSSVLRQVLSGSYRELVHGGTFDLAPVWELLAGQPKFDPAEVMPALAKVKSWESNLGKKVVLPPPMHHLADSELARMAATVHVPAAELARVLRGGMVETDHIDEIPEEVSQGGSRKHARDVAPPPEPRATTRPPRVRLGPRQRKAVMVAAGVVAAVTFGIAGISLARGCQGRTWDRVAVDFAADIPLEKAERSGPEVAATLRDPGWPKLPAARRREQMSAGLRALPAGVEVFFVRDRAGNVIATARWYGKRPRQIAVTLR
jgi:hypothetical protein